MLVVVGVALAAREAGVPGDVAGRCELGFGERGGRRTWPLRVCVAGQGQFVDCRNVDLDQPFGGNSVMFGGVESGVLFSPPRPIA